MASLFLIVVLSGYLMAVGLVLIKIARLLEALLLVLKQPDELQNHSITDDDFPVDW